MISNNNESAERIDLTLRRASPLCAGRKSLFLALTSLCLFSASACSTSIEAPKVEPSSNTSNLSVDNLAAVQSSTDESAEKPTQTPPKRATSRKRSKAREPGERKLVTIAGVDVPFRYIPAGRFEMGSPANERQRVDDETLHEVAITKGFWIAETETTQRLWKAVMVVNPSRFKGDDLLPVERVSWFDSQDFIAKLNELQVSGAGHFRLPTEAEWEYACRSGTTTAYHWGEALNGDKANCDGNYPYGTSKQGNFVGKTTRVGMYLANDWGLFDMNGNVYEWCADWYGEYLDGTQTDPQGAAEGDLRVVRGGAWRLLPRYCRSANRGRLDPNVRQFIVGFRLVMTELE